MNPQTEGPGGGRLRWLWLLPPLLAVAAHANLLRVGLVLEEPRLVSHFKEIGSLSPERAFVDHYIQPRRLDGGYRPLSFASLVAVHDIAGEPWAQRAVNILLHAVVAAGVWFLVQQLTRNRAAATVAACVFAVLPVHSDAVARLVGRAELLSAAAAVWAWGMAAVNSRRSAAGGESLELAALAGGLTLVASFSHESAVVLLPVVMLISCLALRLPVPWLTGASALGAVLGCFAVRALVLEGRAGLASPLYHPLRDADLVERAFHAPAVAALHAFQTLAPVHLSAERTTVEAPLWSWPWALLAIAGWLAALVVLARPAALRRHGLIGAGLAAFALLVAPAALMISPLKRLGAESAAYLPSVGWALVAAGAALALRGKVRAPAVATGVAVLCAVLGARTWLRSADWTSGETVRLIPARGEPGWGRSLFERWGELHEKTPAPLLPELRGFLDDESARLAAAAPRDGWTEALLGTAQFNKNKHAEAIELLTQAEAILARQVQLDALARLFQLRGEAFLHVNQVESAFGDLDRYVRLTDAARRTPDAQSLSRRGVCHARLNRPAEAMVDLDRALSIRKNIAEIWNNRGYLRYQLDDLKGAVEDYREGLAVCMNANIATSAQGDSVQAFSLRIADVYKEWGERLEAEGRVEEGKLALAESEKYRQGAQELGPRPATMSGGK